MNLWYIFLWVLGGGLVLYGVFEAGLKRKNWLLAAICIVIGIVIIPNGVIIAPPVR